MKLKEVFLLVLVIAAGVFFYHAQTGKLNISFDWDDGLFFSYEEFVFQESQELAPPFPRELQIINAHGDLTIEGNDQDKIQILFKKKIRRRNEEEAKEIADRLRMIINEEDRHITISTNRSDFKRKRFRTDFRILIPAGMNITVKNSFGLVKASNTGNADIYNTHGKVFATDIEGNLILQNSYQDVTIENVLYDCHIESRHSIVRAYGIKGSTMIVHRYGRVHLEDLSQTLTIEGSHSKIFGQNITGPADIESSYEEISLIDIGPVVVRGNHSPIDIQDARGSVEINDHYSQVELENIGGDLNITGKSTGVTAKYIRANSIYINTTYKNISLEDFAGKTSITLSHGNILLNPAPLTHSIEVKAAYSGIIFLWPDKEQYLFEAQTKHGDIQWNLPEEPSVRATNGNSIVKAFMDKEQSRAIRLSTSYETILVKKNK
jgi:DUF4097 and DUF4098 domain-containing protein YvlB